MFRSRGLRLGNRSFTFQGMSRLESIVQTLVPPGPGGAGELLVRAEQQGQLPADAHGGLCGGKRRRADAALRCGENHGA